MAGAHNSIQYSQSSDARLTVRVTSGGVLTLLAEFYPPQLSYHTPGLDLDRVLGPTHVVSPEDRVTCWMH